MMQSYFPMRIYYVDSDEECLVGSFNEIKKLEPFKVLEVLV